MAEGSPQEGGERLHGLDGLRGIAALIVVLRHSSNALAMPLESRRALLEGPLAAFFNAQGAVQLFFVLSGYVLARSLAKRSGARELMGYWVRRYLRIQPPFVAAILFAALLGFLAVSLVSPQGLTSWIVPSLRREVPPLRLSHFVFPGTVDGLLRHGWSLRAEMIFSLALPMMLLLAKRAHWGLLLAATGGLLLWAPAGSDLLFGVDFALGISVFLERDRLGRWLHPAPAWLLVVLVLLAIGLFASPAWLGWASPRRDILVYGMHKHEIVIMGVGSALLVALAAHARGVQTLLAARVPRYLGRISYSLYLFHWPILVFLAPFAARAHGWGKLVLFELAVVCTSVLAAHLGQRWIEAPSIRAASRLGRWTATSAMWQLPTRWR